MRNSSYSFIPILLKLYRCHDRALKICMWFGYNPQINFSHFLHYLNLVIFRFFFFFFWTMKVNGQWVPRGRNSSYSFIQILFKLYRCHDHALKICMWFGYNPHINFSHIFCNLNLVIFRFFFLFFFFFFFFFFLTMIVNGQWVPRGPNSSYSFIQILFKLYRCLNHALKICM